MDIPYKVMFTRMSAKAGIWKFGKTTITAMFKEFKQLDEGAKPGNLVVTPTDTKSLSSREKKNLWER